MVRASPCICLVGFVVRDCAASKFAADKVVDPPLVSSESIYFVVSSIIHSSEFLVIIHLAVGT